MKNNYIHKPILINSILDYFNIKSNVIIIDCTTGEGGHSKAFLSVLKKGRLICLDRDSEILNKAKKRLNYSNHNLQIDFKTANFSDLDKILSDLNIKEIDYIFYDLGISMYHYKKSTRGFSFDDKNSLDMSLDQNVEFNAFYIVNKFKEKDLFDVLFYFGEEKKAKRIVRAIIQYRKKKIIENAYELQKIIYSVISKKFYQKTNPATKTFQALRIAVNKELHHLIYGLKLGIKYLKVGGRIGVLSFHSLEDRLVKQMFKAFSISCYCPEELPICCCEGKSIIKNLKKNPIIPTLDDIKVNPSARSAKLRMAEKIADSNKITFQYVEKIIQQKISYYPNHIYYNIGR